MAETKKLSELNADVKEATDLTAKANAAFYDILDFDDRSERENAVRGLIAAPEKLELHAMDDGRVIWSQDAFSFLDDYDKAPDSVNPSLWENTVNNHAYGLFEVVKGIYQVRGYDMANLTLIEGKTGWIVYDTTMGIECAKACMQLVNEHLGEKPVKAVLISHPHIDHFGGVRAFVDEDTIADASLPIEEQIASGKIPVIVPENYAYHAVSENLYAGGAMGRRANYQYGVVLNKSIKGALSIGIGMGQSKGTASYIAPTYEIKRTGEKLVIDGVEMEFHMTPGTEAPAEMNTWFPQFKALWVAENCTCSLHNLYTLRGAQIRDGSAWARYIMEAKARYGIEVEVVFQSHNWPHWGNSCANEFMTNSAAIYKFTNDQTLALINAGYTSDEIAHMIKLPQGLEKNWYTRQYYGTLIHNAKAVYQRFMGWYDANPINLNKLPRTVSAKKWVEYIGDTDRILELAAEDFDKGEYQWVAEVTNMLVFADPENKRARLLCADALEQLGYQAEAGTWRNCYLTAALELRNGNMAPGKKNNFGKDIIANLTPEMIFDYMGIIADRTKFDGRNMIIDFMVKSKDSARKYTLYVVEGTFLFTENEAGTTPDVTVTCPVQGLLLLMTAQMEAFFGISSAEGDTEVLQLLGNALENRTRGAISPFNIIEP